MAEYRDPKVTTPTSSRANMGRWIGIAIAVLLVALALAWFLGAFDREPEVVPVITEQPGAAPPAGAPATPSN